MSLLFLFVFECDNKKKIDTYLMLISCQRKCIYIINIKIFSSPEPKAPGELIV